MESVMTDKFTVQCGLRAKLLRVPALTQAPVPTATPTATPQTATAAIRHLQAVAAAVEAVSHSE